MNLNVLSHYPQDPFLRNWMPEPALLRQKRLREYMDIWIISQKAPLVNYFVNYLSMITLYFINVYALS